MIVASIDIGSNTILLLISQINLNSKTLVPIKNYYRSPRISLGLKNSNQISISKINELISILIDFKEICVKNSVDKILIVATNAFRIASNASLISEKVKNELELNINVISGDLEAALSFLGTTYPLHQNEMKTVIDIGGGSTEVVFGNSEGHLFKKSFQIGVVSLAERFMNSSKISLNDLQIMENYIAKIFDPLIAFIPSGIETIAVAGTPTTLSCIKQNIKFYDEVKVENSEITYDELCLMISEISKFNPEQILENYGQVVEGREDVLLAGSIILKKMMEKLEISKLKVSIKGLRYGVIVDYMLKNFQ